jgi:hypothetical protein
MVAIGGHARAWRFFAAAAIFSGCFYLAPANGANGQTKMPNGAIQPPSSAPAPQANAAPPAPPEKPPSCAVPRTRTDREECDQHAAVVAAQEQARSAHDQLIVALVGLPFVVLGLGFTGYAALSAGLAVRAAIALELPVIRVLGPEYLINVDQPPGDGPFGGGVNNGIPGKYSALPDLAVRNDGRTPAHPTRVHAGWSISKTLPKHPTYLHHWDSPKGFIVKADDGQEVSIKGLCIEASDADIARLKTGEANLWFYAKVEYLDFMEKPHSVAYCWYWGRPDGVGMYYFVRALDVPGAYLHKR